MKRKIILAVVLLIVVIAAVAGWKYFEKTDDLVEKEPAAKVTAGDLIAAFDSDTAAAAKLYLNKVIEVTGIITKVDLSAVEMGENDSPSVVAIGLDERHLGDIGNLKTGTQAILQGECTGYDKASGDDLLASLGVTVHLRAAGVKNKN